MIRRTAVFGFVFIGLIFVLIVLNSEPEAFGKQRIENIVSKQETACAIYLENGDCAALVTNSIIDLSNIVESDQTVIEQFLESTSIDLLQSKFGVETVVLLIDPNGTITKSSSILEVPFFDKLAVTDPMGKILDLSDLKASFYFISKEPATAITVEGDVEFYLDDTKIATKKIFVSGNTLTNRTLQMSVADTAFGSFLDRKDGFGFTFVDEIPNWQDNTDHTFRVILKKITGTASEEGKSPKTLDWSGEHISYELKMNYDGTKLAKIQDGEVKLEFKSDSTISICGVGKQVTTASLYSYEPSIKTSSYNPHVIKSNPAIPPKVEIYQSGKLIKIIDPIVPVKNAEYTAVALGTNIIYSVTKQAGIDCNKFESLQRNTDYVIKIDNLDYPIKTKLTQENFFLTCEHSGVKVIDGSPMPNSYHQYGLSNYDKKVCTSNFGFEKTYLIS